MSGEMALSVGQREHVGPMVASQRGDQKIAHALVDFQRAEIVSAEMDVPERKHGMCLTSYHLFTEFAERDHGSSQRMIATRLCSRRTSSEATNEITK